MANDNIQNRSTETILGGFAVSEYFNQNWQFLSSLAIDPEMPKDDSATKPSGLIRPTSMAKFSATEVTGVPLWFINNAKTDTTYLYAGDGKIHTIKNDFTMDTSAGTVTTSSGNWAAYYNNYIYFAKNTDIARFGPLSGTAALTQDWWTASPLSKTALANTTYPAISGVTIPNHPMCVHANRLYVGDVNSSGIGVVHMINTKKTTAEGDTDDTTVPSAYNVLDFNYQWFPTCLSPYGNYLAIGVIEGNSILAKQGNAKVLIWDTLATTTAPNIIAELPDPLITAMKYVNGILYVFSGNATGGMRISRYLGGEQFEELFFIDGMYPPFQWAVDYQINRIVWGTGTTNPVAAGVVMSLGSKVRNLQMGVHCILSPVTGTNAMVTAVKYVSQGETQYPLTGWKVD